MKRILFILFLVGSGTIIFAQNNSDTIVIRPLNNISVNVLGDASLISLNYERLFLINPNTFITGKIGIGYNEEFQLFSWGDATPPSKYLTIPHHITVNFGKRKHFFEAGLGGTFIHGNTSQHYIPYPIVGYRLQPLKSNKLNFRVFVCFPFSGLDSKQTDDIIFSLLGLSLGICL